MGKIGGPVNATFLYGPEDFGEVVAQRGILILVTVSDGKHIILAKNGTSYTILNPVFTGNDGKVNAIGNLVIDAGLAKREDLEIEAVALEMKEEKKLSILDGVI